MRARYNPEARDADLDRIVQEGTPYARPATPRIAMAKPARARAGRNWTKEEATTFAKDAWEMSVPASDGSGTFTTHIWGVTNIADEGEPPEWWAEVGLRFRPTGADEDEEVETVIERYVEPAKREVNHSWLILPPELRRKGFATAFGDQEDKAYRAAGMKRITLVAGGADGPYVWALEGYDFDDAKAEEYGQKGRTEIADALEENLLGNWEGLTPEARAEGEDLLMRVRAGYKATPYEFAMLGKDHARPGFEHLGRHLMGLGVNWYGVREL